MKSNRSRSESKSYANLQLPPPWSTLIRNPAVVLAVHWVFQGILYMGKSERRFKLLLDLLLTIVFMLPLSLGMELLWALASAFLLAHTVNFMFNGQIWSSMKGFGWVTVSPERFDRFRQELSIRTAGESSIIYAGAFGSLARGAKSMSSDLDVRIIRSPGFRNGIRACLFVFKERARAFVARFPLDIYLLDSAAGLARLNPMEKAIVFVDHEAIDYQRAAAPTARAAQWREIVGLIQESLFANAGYLLSVQALNSAAGFLFWALAARLYSAESVGQAATMVSVVAMISSVSLLGFDVGAVQFLPGCPSPGRLLNTLLTFAMAASTAATLLFIGGLSLLPSSLDYLGSGGIALAFLAFTIATATYRMTGMAFLARQKGVYLLLQAGIANFARLALLLFLIEMSAAGLAAAMSLGMVLASLVSIFYFLPRIGAQHGFRPQISWQELREMSSFASSNFLAGISAQLPQWLLPVFVLSLLGPTAAAYAYIPWMLGMILASPGAALSSSAFAEGAAHPDRAGPLLSRALVAGLCYSASAAVFAAAAAPWILQVFGGSYARSSVSLFRWLAIATPFSFISSLYFTKMRLNEQLRRIVLLGMAIALITLASAYVGLPKLGIKANGLGWLAAHLIVSIAALADWSSRRRLPRSAAA